MRKQNSVLCFQSYSIRITFSNGFATKIIEVQPKSCCFLYNPILHLAYNGPIQWKQVNDFDFSWEYRIHEAVKMTELFKIVYHGRSRKQFKSSIFSLIYLFIYSYHQIISHSLYNLLTFCVCLVNSLERFRIEEKISYSISQESQVEDKWER